MHCPLLSFNAVSLGVVAHRKSPRKKRRLVRSRGAEPSSGECMSCGGLSVGITRSCTAALHLNFDCIFYVIIC